jgi:hypothetical protein
VRRLPVLAPHVDLVGRARGGELDQPAAAGPGLTDEPHVRDAEQPRLLPDGPLGRLDRERVAAAAAVVGEVDLARERRLEHAPGAGRLDASVVDAVRESDEIPGEAVAADVSRLPDPAVLDLLADGVVERSPVLRAAAVVLAVRADEQEGMGDGLAGRRKVDREQVVVPLELEPTEAPLGLGRACDEREQPVAAPPLGPADEEDPAVRRPRPLGREVALQLRGERRAVDRVVPPEAAVLDQDPGVDPARGRGERLLVRPRGLGAEWSSRPGRGRSPARS